MEPWARRPVRWFYHGAQWAVYLFVLSFGTWVLGSFLGPSWRIWGAPFALWRLESRHDPVTKLLKVVSERTMGFAMAGMPLYYHGCPLHCVMGILQHGLLPSYARHLVFSSMQRFTLQKYDCVGEGPKATRVLGVWDLRDSWALNGIMVCYANEARTPYKYHSSTCYFDLAILVIFQGCAHRLLWATRPFVKRSLSFSHAREARKLGPFAAGVCRSPFFWQVKALFNRSRPASGGLRQPTRLVDSRRIYRCLSLFSCDKSFFAALARTDLVWRTAFSRSQRRAAHLQSWGRRTCCFWLLFLSISCFRRWLHTSRKVTWPSVTRRRRVAAWLNRYHSFASDMSCLIAGLRYAQMQWTPTPRPRMFMRKKS